MAALVSLKLLKSLWIFKATYLLRQLTCLKHFHKCKSVHQRTQEDGHYRENPSNHELLTVREGDCRASKKMFWGLLPPYCIIDNVQLS